MTVPPEPASGVSIVATELPLTESFGILANVNLKTNPCGNGKVDAAEECDDGNDDDDDSCTNSCTTKKTPVCGDGIVNQPEEQCDDYNGGPTCTIGCKAIVCGDGVKQGDEQCDHGGADATCSWDCKNILCGDNQVTGPEECDYGFNSPGLCNPTTCRAVRCGNGELEEGEQCDDGPNGSPTCTFECKLPTSARNGQLTPRTASFSPSWLFKLLDRLPVVKQAAAAETEPPAAPFYIEGVRTETYPLNELAAPANWTDPAWLTEPIESAYRSGASVGMVIHELTNDYPGICQYRQVKGGCVTHISVPYKERDMQMYFDVEERNRLPDGRKLYDVKKAYLSGPPGSRHFVDPQGSFGNIYIWNYWGSNGAARNNLYAFLQEHTKKVLKPFNLTDGQLAEIAMMRLFATDAQYNYKVWQLRELERYRREFLQEVIYAVNRVNYFSEMISPDKYALGDWLADYAKRKINERIKHLETILARCNHELTDRDSWDSNAKTLEAAQPWEKNNYRALLRACFGYNYKLMPNVEACKKVLDPTGAANPTPKPMECRWPDPNDLPV